MGSVSSASSRADVDEIERALVMIEAEERRGRSEGSQKEIASPTTAEVGHDVWALVRAKDDEADSPGRVGARADQDATTELLALQDIPRATRPMAGVGSMAQMSKRVRGADVAVHSV